MSLDPHRVIDRRLVSQALAKAIAYKECGKDEMSRRWATHLVMLLGNARILTGEACNERLIEGLD